MDTQELMKMMVKMDHISYIDSFPSSLAITGDEVDQKSSSSLGFMDILGFQDYYTSSIFDYNNTTTFDELQLPSADQPLKHDDNDDGLKQDADDVNITTVEHEEETSSVVLSGQQPLSPNNSSCISSHAHQLLHKPIKQCMKAKKSMNGNETKTTKKKKEKEARFAFMTRTEIDHLDDGYRWRKYGQKAVKNSHFPRSYYRCTSASCNVKKRVERCMGDPSYVVTTYEGQHTHPVNANSAPLIPSFNHLINTTTAPPSMLNLDQGGVLQDMMFCHQQNH